MGYEQVQGDSAGPWPEAGPLRQGCKADGPHRVPQDEHSEDSQFVVDKFLAMRKYHVSNTCISKMPRCSPASAVRCSVASATVSAFEVHYGCVEVEASLANFLDGLLALIGVSLDGILYLTRALDWRSKRLGLFWQINMHPRMFIRNEREKSVAAARVLEL